MKTLSFTIDTNLCINSWGEEIAHFTGKPPGSCQGNKYYDVLPPIYIEGNDALAEVVRTNKPLSLNKIQIPCLFAHMNADVDITPLKSAGGNAKEVKVTLFPASTCAAAHKLNQSQKLIDIGKIASTLAHGVRNPLNAIKGAVVYLSEKYSHEAPLVEFTKIMEDEISRLENFISKFLSSSVSDTEDKETDINSLLKKIEVFISLQIYTRNIQSLFEFGTIPPVIINSFHLEQAILNVINNAIDAMGSGGQLRIGTSAEERDGKVYVVVSVADTGQGMAQKRIGELSSGQGNNGRGFGLFITYEILKHYHGHLEIDSKMNSGTTIKLFIPSRSNA